MAASSVAETPSAAVIVMLMVVLIVRAHPAGPPLAVAVMPADATANWWTQAGDVMRHPLHYLVPVGLLPITAFAVFVLVTAKPLCRAMTESAQRPIGFRSDSLRRPRSAHEAEPGSTSQVSDGEPGS